MQQQQRNLKPEQALERLIDQELAVQKAHSLNLDDEPRVALAMLAAQREVLARAYAEKVAESASAPGADEVRRYFDEHPALFSQRRIYNLQEYAIELPPEQVPALRETLAELKSVEAFLAHLKRENIRFAGAQAVRAAEQLPLAMLETFAQMKDGQAFVSATPTGAQVVVLIGSRDQPVTEDQARPAIENYLLTERKLKLIEADRKALREAARIEVYGGAATLAASAASR